MDSLAIIGYAVRYPQEATDSMRFWDFLLKARESSTAFPEDRINSKAFYHPDPDHGGTFHTKRAHFLRESPVAFDAAFFKVSKAEVLSLDPLHRLVMENTYHAMENAGIPMADAISSNTSVFVNGYNHDHADNLNSDPENILKYKPAGSENSLISGRLSWFYDFRGPSLTVETACSGSLVGLHLACQSLKAKESDMAIVSGVNVIGYLSHMVSMSYSGFMGSEGKCFAFDHRADGYSRGEGVGTVIVKRLSTAVEDGDTIRAVIRGTGWNQDGRTPGITYPGLASQQRLIEKTYQTAGLDTDETCYLESHGTGTQAGDWVEASAINRAFDTKKRDLPLYIGALKTNTGHLEGGSGIAGLIKTIIILETGIIPPNANFEKPNQKIPIDQWKLSLPTKCEAWPTSKLRRASVSSFGLSGTNSHCILDDTYSFLRAHGISAKHKTLVGSPSDDELELIRDGTLYAGDDMRRGPDNKVLSSESLMPSTNSIRGKKSPPALVLLSSFDKTSFTRVVSDLTGYINAKRHSLSKNEGKFLDDLSFTLSQKRTRFNYTACILASSVSQLQSRLAKDSLVPHYWRGVPRLGFVFTGQGAQYPGMGRQLLAYSVFRKSLEAAEKYFLSLGSEWLLLEELDRAKDRTIINQPAVAHPSSTAIQIALVDLLASWGISPTRVVGHSSGEIAAAYCAGKISRQAAWRVAFFRGQVTGGSLTPPGSMMAVGLNADELQPLLEQVQDKYPDGTLGIACFNSPKNQTVSGDSEMVDALKSTLDTKRVFARKLNIEKAYHSEHMKAITESYQASVGSLEKGELPSPDQPIAMFSTFTGEEIVDASLYASYWCANIVGAVKFEQALRALCYTPSKEQCLPNRVEDMSPQIDELVEIGAHGALRSAIKETINTAQAITYHPTLDRANPNTEALLQSVADLASKGFPVNILAVNNADGHCKDPAMLVDLPPYPFNHENKDIYESRLAKNHRLRKYPRHDIFGAPVADFDPRYPKWRHFLRLHENPWLRQHKIDGRYVFPPAGYMAMGIESSMQMADKERSVRGIHLERITFGPLLAIPEESQGIELALSHHDNDTGGWTRFQVSSYSESQSCWTQHCTADVSIEYDEDNKIADLDLEHEHETNGQGGRLSHCKSRCESPVKFDDMCKRLSSCGLELGPVYQALSGIGVSGHGEGTSTALVEVPDISSTMPKCYMHPHSLHPVTLNNLLLPAAAAVYDLQDSLDIGIFMPSFIERAWVSTKPSYGPHSQFDCVGTASVTGRDKYRCNIEVVHESSSESAISFNGVLLGLYETEGRLSKTETLPHFYSVEWKPDIHLLTNSFFDQLVPQSTSAKVQYKSEGEWFTDLQLASTLLSTDALLHLKGMDLSGLEPHYIRFYDLLKHIAADVLTDSIPNVPFKTWKKYAHDPGLKESLYRKVEARDSDGALLIRVGTKIPSFFRKEVNPLYIMFGQDDLMTEYYKSDFEIGSISKKLGHFLDLFRWNRSNLRVLEVGGGTGSFTANALSHLCPPDTDRSVSDYVFTDISAGFFEKAKHSLRDWSDIMTFKKFDVGSDPISQGLEPGTFDLIVASNVLHATPDLHQTLKNIHCLLKPGGKLAVHEGVRQDTLWTNLSFSPLSGWWLSTEPERRWCPYIPTETWDRYLCETGFSGLDLEFPSSNIADFSKISLMISTAKSDGAPNVLKDVAIVVDEGGSPLAQDFQRQIEQLGFSTFMGEAKEIEATDLSHKICVMFLSSTPRNSGTRTYENVQSILSRSNNTLFVTGDSSRNPVFDIAVGLIRHRRIEQGSDANLVAVSVVDTEFPEAICKSLVKIFQHQFYSHAVSAKNAEYRLEQGVVLTNRVTPNIDANVTIRGRLSAPESVAVQWSDIGRPVKLISHGRLDWETDALLSDHPICDDDVELDISAVGIGFRDLLVSKGELPQRTLGQEASGVVRKIGTAVKHIQPGDRVMCISDTRAGGEGTLRTAIRVSSSLVTRIPPGIPFEAAAELPMSYLTAIYSLEHIGRLVAGEKILIHAAGNSVGQAAIQYAQVIGAEIFATVSDAKERDYISLGYGLKHDHIFYGRSTSLRNQVNRHVPGGMDVILSSSTETIRTSLNCMAPFGRLIDISHGSYRTHNMYTSSTDNITMAKVDINSLARSRPATIQQLFREMAELVEAHKIRPRSSTRVLPYSQINNAIEMLQEDTAGHIVLRPSNDDSVQVIPEVPAPVPLDNKASYLLIGALGPLQCKIALHMAGRGAQDLILLSRSPSLDSEDTQQILNHLRDRGCRVHLYHCNLSQESEFQSLVSSWRSELPPVNGVIKSAYHPDCNTGLSPQSEKPPNGTSTERTSGPDDEITELLNIHNAFSSIDFFIMVSSITELTAKHDTSLKAAETFQDALAHHRLASGLHAASFHVGDMEEEEILAAIDYMTERHDPPQNSCPLTGNPPTPSLYQHAQDPIPEYLLDPLFSQLLMSRSREATITETQQRPSVGNLLKKTNSTEQAKVVVMGEIRRKLSNLLNVSEDEIDEKADIRRNGVDSLIEMEFRDWMNKELRVTVSPDDLTRKDMSTLSEHVVVESPLVSFS